MELKGQKKDITEDTVWTETYADGYIQITLDASRSTDIKVYCTDSDGEPQWYTWSVTYERVLDPAENQRKAPVIRADVTNETVNKNPFIIPIKVFDYNGNELKANQNFTLYSGLWIL